MRYRLGRSFSGFRHRLQHLQCRIPLLVVIDRIERPHEFDGLALLHQARRHGIGVYRSFERFLRCWATVGHIDSLEEKADGHVENDR
jgi:hypothetical protein